MDFCDIPENIFSGQTCRETYKNTFSPAKLAAMAEHPKETLLSHDLPDYLWQKIVLNLFEFNNFDNLVTVVYAKFGEIIQLEDIISLTVICKLKTHLKRYGIQCWVVSDTDLQFTPSSFSHFSER